MEFNTIYGILTLSLLFTEGDVKTYECYDEYDQYYGMVTFKDNEVITDSAVEQQLITIRS